MRLSKKIKYIVLLICFVLAVCAISSAANDTGIRCYITACPENGIERDSYTEGDVLLLIAHIDDMNEATPTDLLAVREFSITWQMSDDGEHDWRNIGEGYMYRLVLSVENITAWYRFYAE